MDPGTATLVASGLGLMGGKEQSRKASKQVATGQALERQMASRLTKLFDTLLGKVTAADEGGLFDPEKRFERARQNVDREFDLASEKMAGDMRIAGGKPGEQAVVSRLAGLRAKQVESLQRMKDQIEQESFFNKLEAYKAANPGLATSAAGIGGTMANRGLAQQPDASSFFASIMPFLGQKKQSAFDSAWKSLGNQRWML